VLCLTDGKTGPAIGWPNDVNLGRDPLRRLFPGSSGSFRTMGKEEAGLIPADRKPVPSVSGMVVATDSPNC
jgi:hypothetical protein